MQYRVFTGRTYSQAKLIIHVLCTIKLTPDTAIILLYFAENYSFTAQDAVQGFHWENSQATHHPVAVYHKVEGKDKLQCMSVCIILDCLMHDTTAVHAFTDTVTVLLDFAENYSFIV